MDFVFTPSITGTNAQILILSVVSTQYGTMENLALR
jgi:hypothetical protein